MDREKRQAVRRNLEKVSRVVAGVTDHISDPRWMPDRSVVLGLTSILERTAEETRSLLQALETDRPDQAATTAPAEPLETTLRSEVGPDGEGQEAEWIRRAHEQDAVISASEVEFFAEFKRRAWLGRIARVPSPSRAEAVQQLAHMRLTGMVADSIGEIVDTTIDAILRDDGVHDPLVWPIETAPRDGTTLRAVQKNSEGEVLNHCWVRWIGGRWEIDLDTYRTQQTRPCGDPDQLTHWIDPLGFPEQAEGPRGGPSSDPRLLAPVGVVPEADVPAPLPADLTEDAVERIARTVCTMEGRNPDDLVPYVVAPGAAVFTERRPRWENAAAEVVRHHRLYASIIRETLWANRGEMQDWLRDQIRS